MKPLLEIGVFGVQKEQGSLGAFLGASKSMQGLFNVIASNTWGVGRWGAGAGAVSTAALQRVEGRGLLELIQICVYSVCLHVWCGPG